MTVSKIFFYICLSFIGGIFLNSAVFIRELTMLGFLVLGILLISVFWHHKRLVITGFCILFLVLGVWRHQTVETQSMKSELRSLNDKEEIINLVGIVIAEPDIREKSMGLIIQPKDLANYENGSRSIEGKILVASLRYPEYQYGDKLRIAGKLETPPVFESFNYRDYLKKDGIYSVMNWPEIELVERGLGGPVMEFLYSFKNKFKEVACRFISPPQEGILEALIFGDENNISKEWKEKLNLTGTRHIAAVSGMNITIIASLILAFALSLGLWRQQTFYLSLFLLTFYILMIGAPASAVRAGIMAGILMTAQYFGRLSAAPRAVVFAAFLMLLNNPLLLMLDVGFQLSFLAILGIIYLQPIFLDKLRFFPNPKLFPLRTTLTTTLAAQVFTLPILVYNFGYIPLVSPITNILIVPFLAPITILIFIFGLTGIAFLPFGLIFFLPVWFFLTYIVKVIDFFSEIPYAVLHFSNIHWVFLLISYFILGFITWRTQESQKLKFLRY